MLKKNLLQPKCIVHEKDQHRIARIINQQDSSSVSTLFSKPAGRASRELLSPNGTAEVGWDNAVSD